MVYCCVHFSIKTINCKGKLNHVNMTTFKAFKGQKIIKTGPEIDMETKIERGFFSAEK